MIKIIEKIIKETDYENFINAIPYISQKGDFVTLSNEDPFFRWRYQAVERVFFEFNGYLLNLKENKTYTIHTSNKIIFDSSQLMKVYSAYEADEPPESTPPGLNFSSLLQQEDILKFIAQSVNSFFSDPNKKYIKIFPFIYEDRVVLEFENVILDLDENGNYVAHGAEKLRSHPFQGKRKLNKKNN